MNNRRVSLPVALGVPYYPTHVSTTHLSPCMISPTRRHDEDKSLGRSLPSTPTPGGGRRSLPGTPRNSSPRSGRPLPDVDERFASSSSSTSTSFGSETTSPRRSKRRNYKYHQHSLQTESIGQRSEVNDEMAPEEDGALRSFKLQHGELIDDGYQPSIDQRRATCPEIWKLPPAATKAIRCDDDGRRHVVLRIYGSKNTGKKTLARQIHHHGTTTRPELVDQGDEEPLPPQTLRFLLNDQEIELEILLGAALEGSLERDATLLFMIVYNVDSRESFVWAAQLVERIARSRSAPIVLVGNKVDLKRNQVVSTMEGKSLAKVYNCGFAEVSALLAMNLDELWSEVLLKLQVRCDFTEQPHVSWMEKMVNRGRHIAKSCEGILTRIIT